MAKVLRTYHQIGSVTDTVRQLGYQSREHLYAWIRNEGKTKEKRKEIERLWTYTNFIMMSQNTVEKSTIIP